MADLASALQHLLSAKRVSAPSQSYRKDNPGEYAKVVAYLQGGVRPTGVVTEMGLGLLEVEDVRRGAGATGSTGATGATGATGSTGPPPASGALGLGVNADPGAAWLAKAATLNPKYIREDAISQYKVDWAVAQNAKFIGVCNLNASGAAASMAKVNQWPQITLWELDNEPYFEGVNVSSWAQSALALAQQIKAAHPGHQVILPMLVQVNNGDYNTGGQWSPWANQVLNAAPGLVQISDFVSGHPYQQGAAPTTIFSTVDKVRGECMAKGLSKPWHMTEAGWSVGTGGGQVSAAQQAQYLNDLIVGLRNRTWVASIEVYCLQTWGAGYEQSFGLFNQDMSDRPAAVTFRSLV